MTPESVRFVCPRCDKPYRAPRQQVEASGGRLGIRCSSCGQPMRVRWTGAGAEVEPLPEGSAPPVVGEEPHAPDALPAVGERVGRYELQGLVGRGGMGSVYRAFDPATNRVVALKLLSPGAPEEAAVRFQREIEVQGNVHHPNLMPIFDSGAAGPLRFYTMELLREPFELSQLILLARSGDAARTSRLKPLATLAGLVRHVMVPVCEAIHHANVREGVLHRDLTPSNVLVDAVGLRPYVIDFGVCALLERRNARLAHLKAPTTSAEGGVRRVTGTLTYMPPEQLRGEVHHHGDVWALGALLHAIVTGEPPLAPAVKAVVPRSDRLEGLRLLMEQAEREGDLGEVEQYRTKALELKEGRERTLADLHRDILDGRYQPRPPLLDAALDAIIAKAMAPEPGQRYRNARALRDDLEAWLGGRAVEALVERHSGVGRSAYRARLLLRRHRGWIAAGTLVALGAAAWLLWPQRDGGPGLPERKRAAAARWTEQNRSLEPLQGPARRALAGWIALDPEDPAPWEALEARRAQVAAAQEALERSQRRSALEEAERSGDAARVSAAAARLSEVAERAQDAELLALAQGLRRLEIAGGAPGGVLSVRAVEADGSIGPARAAPRALAPGRWIVVSAAGGREGWTPVEVARSKEPLRVGPLPEVAALPEGCVFVPAGRVRGPQGESQVPALVWERTEVSIGRYAAWLATLPMEEQERRVPRQAGPLGEAPRPLWTRREVGFAPPQGTNLLHPVDAISLYDARAFALAQGRRLPSAQEWAWAAAGPFAWPTPVGEVGRLFSPDDGLALGSGVRAPHAVGTEASDVSPFGLRDLAGNVAEWTETLATFEGTSGWLVMGSGYGLPPERALLKRAAPEPGWRPLSGVGFRLVFPLP